MRQFVWCVAAILLVGSGISAEMPIQQAIQLLTTLKDHVDRASNTLALAAPNSPQQLKQLRVQLKPLSSYPDKQIQFYALRMELDLATAQKDFASAAMLGKRLLQRPECVNDKSCYGGTVRTTMLQMLRNGEATAGVTRVLKSHAARLGRAGRPPLQIPGDSRVDLWSPRVCKGLGSPMPI